MRRRKLIGTPNKPATAVTSTMQHDAPERKQQLGSNVPDTTQADSPNFVALTIADTHHRSQAPLAEVRLPGGTVVQLNDRQMLCDVVSVVLKQGDQA